VDVGGGTAAANGPPDAVFLEVVAIGRGLDAVQVDLNQALPGIVGIGVSRAARRGVGPLF
jgi:hypothetical protein